MRRFALMISATLVAVTALAGSAHAHEWGGGRCIGYGCIADRYDDDGYRSVRHHDEDLRPDVRIYERRVDRHHPDWDEDDDE